MRTSISVLLFVALLTFAAGTDNIEDGTLVAPADTVRVSENELMTDEDVEDLVGDMNRNSILKLMRMSSTLPARSLRNRRLLPVAMETCMLMRRTALELASLAEKAGSRSFFGRFLLRIRIIIIWWDWIIIIIIRRFR
ncbi:unnamed protein product [Chondrus crispus]|uniref:Uncharacterized protein n=1 Tax=Chondrus crispus TaxID=2769 RepID=R7QLA3_CHOCR|nr:unnamed protein product [Chondrus crispus]CDF38175.1 unnamed protein product [Chondrus crispus]|eukprot:XP_005718044.1 unnamed protein product [Chondrus crispus]